MPPSRLDTTVKYRAQDEALLRGATLNVYLTLQRKPLIYAIYRTGRGFLHYLLCS